MVSGWLFVVFVHHLSTTKTLGGQKSNGGHDIFKCVHNTLFHCFSRVGVCLKGGRDISMSKSCLNCLDWNTSFNKFCRMGVS